MKVDEFIEMVSTMCECVCQVKVDEFIEMVSTTVETYSQLFCDGDMTKFSSNDEAHFVLALSGVVTSQYQYTLLVLLPPSTLRRKLCFRHVS